MNTTERTLSRMAKRISCLYHEAYKLAAASPTGGSDMMRLVSEWTTTGRALDALQSDLYRENKFDPDWKPADD